MLHTLDKLCQFPFELFPIHIYYKSGYEKYYGIYVLTN